MSLFSKKERPQFRELFISDKNRKLRIILLCVFLGIGIIAIATGVMEFLNVDPGWQEVEALPDGVNCSQDFVFQYNFGSGGGEATTVRKALVTLYSDAVEKAYWLFTPDQETTEFANVYTINHNVNTQVTVDPVLYEAFSLLEQYGSRYLYLGPVYQVYNNIFYSTSDDDAQYWDPDTDPDSARYVAQLAAFAQDKDAISLELLEDNQVILKVSEEYQAFAQENEIENYIDFHWMTNAFIVDYFADLCLEQGYTNGFFVSQDGYTRNLNSGTEFSFNLFDREEETIFPVGVMSYDRPLSIVFLHGYPMVEGDSLRCYTYSTGKITTSFIDSSDGMDKAAVSDLVSYSESATCAQILLQIAPVYIADSFQEDALADLAKGDIHSIWYENFTVCHTEEALQLTSLLDDGNYRYTSQLMK